MKGSLVILRLQLSKDMGFGTTYCNASPMALGSGLMDSTAAKAKFDDCNASPMALGSGLVAHVKPPGLDCNASPMALGSGPIQPSLLRSVTDELQHQPDGFGIGTGTLKAWAAERGRIATPARWFWDRDLKGLGIVTDISSTVATPARWFWDLDWEIRRGGVTGA